VSGAVLRQLMAPHGWRNAAGRINTPASPLLPVKRGGAAGGSPPKPTVRPAPRVAQTEVVWVDTRRTTRELGRKRSVCMRDVKKEEVDVTSVKNNLRRQQS
jgi:hypothetical protein